MGVASGFEGSGVGFLRHPRDENMPRQAEPHECPGDVCPTTLGLLKDKPQTPNPNPEPYTLLEAETPLKRSGDWV